MNRTLIRLYFKNTAETLLRPGMPPQERRMLIIAAVRRARAYILHEKYGLNYVQIGHKLKVTPSQARFLVRTTKIKGELYARAEKV